MKGLLTKGLYSIGFASLLCGLMLTPNSTVRADLGGPIPVPRPICTDCTTVCTGTGTMCQGGDSCEATCLCTEYPEQSKKYICK